MSNESRQVPLAEAPGMGLWDGNFRKCCPLEKVKGELVHPQTDVDRLYENTITCSSVLLEDLKN